MSTRLATLSVLVSALTTMGCGGGLIESGEVDEAGSASSELLITGKGDFSDSKCNVVLRDLSRVSSTTGGYANDCTSGKCWPVFQGSIDLSAAAAKESTWVGVQYRSSVDNYSKWYEAKAVAAAGAPQGMKRYTVKMSQYTFDPGMSGTSITRTRIEVAPFFKSSKGGRMFDHNRIPGAFDNYVLDQSNQWILTDDKATCSPVAPPAPVVSRASISFLADWTNEQHGALVAGGVVQVQYDPARLSTCTSTHNGYPGWTIEGTARFTPGGETATLGQLSFTGPTGQPTLTPSWTAFDVKVPAGATGAELWFRNSDVNNCQAWDSNQSRNYRFPVLAKPLAAVAWAGNWGNGFNRECVHQDGLAEPMMLDSWIRERACMFVDAEVYVVGLTDATIDHPEYLLAQVEVQADGGATKTVVPLYVGRAGNNYRFRWAPPRDDMNNTFWNAYTFDFRFSTDGGATWFRIGKADGPVGGAARTLKRDASWCNSGWAGCP